MTPHRFLGSALFAAGALSTIGCHRVDPVATDARERSARTARSLGARPAEDPAPRSTTVPRECTFDDVRFEMEKGADFGRAMLPAAVESLEGERIRIRGYMLPSFQQRGITRFVLVRDNMECCFGPGAALFDCIVVEMVPGQAADFSIRPVTVTGRFSIRELLGPDGRHLAIYHLKGDEVGQ